MNFSRKMKLFFSLVVKYWSHFFDGSTIYTIHIRFLVNRLEEYSASYCASMYQLQARFYTAISSYTFIYISQL